MSACGLRWAAVAVLMAAASLSVRKGDLIGMCNYSSFALFVAAFNAKE